MAMRINDGDVQSIFHSEAREKQQAPPHTNTLSQDIVVQSGQLPIPEYPVILGHEGAGTIVAIGASVTDKSLRVGDNVLLSFTICQRCDPCREGRPTFCVDHNGINFRARRHLDVVPDSTDAPSTPARLTDTEGTAVRSQFFGHSSFARMSVVEGYCVVKCPVPDLLACYAPLGCGFQTGAGTVLNALKPTKSARVVVFGLGSVGLAALMAAKHLEVRQLVGVDVVEGRLALAKTLGATHVVNAAAEGENLAAKLRDITGGGADFAIDCSGAAAALQAAVDCIAYGGSAVSVGVPPPGVKIDLETQPFMLANKTFRSVIEGESTPSKVRIWTFFSKDTMAVRTADLSCSSSRSSSTCTRREGSQSRRSVRSTRTRISTRP